MRIASLVVIALALIVLTLGAGTPAGGEDGPRVPSSETVVVKKAATPAGHDVWEARLVLLTPAHRSTDGLDLRIRHVLGGEAPEAGSRFFTVSAEPDPETLVTNLGKLGTLEILDRANIPMSSSREASYVKGSRIPVPQVETRTQAGGPNAFVRTKFEEIGTKVRMTEIEKLLIVKVETSFLLAITEPYGQPVIGTASWQIGLEIPVGRTAVLRSHYRLPGALLTNDAGGFAVPGPRVKVAGAGADVGHADVGRVLIVLLTRSRLP